MTIPWDDEMGIQIAMMIAGLINEHAWCEKGDDCDEPCCSLCCAPCSALEWFMTYQHDNVTRWMRLWNIRILEQARREYPDQDVVRVSPHIWQNDDYSICWSMITPHWRLTECHQA